MNKWKTIGIVAVVLAVIILSFAVSSKKEESTNETLSDDVETIINNAQRESSQVSEDEIREPIQIDVYDYLEYKAGEEKKIILLARPTCGYCQIAEPIINNIAYEYDIEINYLNTDDFDEEAQTLFVKSDDRFMEFGTPYLFIVQEGNILDAVDGLTDHAHYMDFFKRNGFIE